MQKNREDEPEPKRGVKNREWRVEMNEEKEEEQ